MIKAQLWVEMDPGTSEPALKMLDVLAGAEAERMNCNIQGRESAINPDNGLLLVYWQVTPRS